MVGVSFRRAVSALGMALAALGVADGGAAASGYETLYVFPGGDGARNPDRGALLQGAHGDFYGTTIYGGTGDLGTVYRIAPDNSVTILHSFTGQRADGSAPPSGVIADAKGNLFGVTLQGGRYNNGTVYRVSPNGKYKILHDFAGGAGDGMVPAGRPILDAQGNLYGTTTQGGGSANCQNGCGIVYKLAPDGTLTLLHAFTGGNDGAMSTTEMIRDAQGNFYGTTAAGGPTNGGTVFRLAPDGTETVLYAFVYKDGGKGKRHSISPQTGLVMDEAGNLYGTTSQDGHLHYNKCPYHVGCGSVFRLSPDGRMKVLHLFTGGSDGARPLSTLILDAGGSLYGTTSAGGGGADCDGMGCGTAFRISPDGSMAILHEFRREQGPPGALTLTGKGDFVGATGPGRYNTYGTVFRIRE